MKTHCVILLSLSGLLYGPVASFGQAPAAALAVGAQPEPGSASGRTSRSGAPGASRAAAFDSTVSIIFDRCANITERLSTAHRLGRNLTPAQVSRLYAFLKALPNPQEKNLPGLRLLKNDLISLLQEQIRPPAGLTDTLIEIYRDPAQDPVVRDYALQHLVTWYEQGAADAPQAEDQIQMVLKQAAAETNSMAGTALLGLHRLFAGEPPCPLAQPDALPTLHPTMTRDAPRVHEISQMALRMVCAMNFPVLARITAIQVCAEEDVAEALPKIEVLARSDGSLGLRISAIAALGRLGGPEQLTLLQRLRDEQNPALKPAIDGALRRLQARLLKYPVITQNSL